MAKQMESIQAMIREQCLEAYKQAISDFLGALEYDIESIVEIGFDGCRDIFVDKKTQKYISDRIMKEMEKRLRGMNFRH